MPSVNLIQFSEPRIQPANAGPTPAGDPFGELLDSVSAPPRADNDVRERPSPRQEPVAPRPRQETRSEALKRDDVCRAEATRCVGKAPMDQPSKTPETESSEAAADEPAEIASANPDGDESASEDLLVAENVEAPVKAIVVAGENDEANAGDETALILNQPAEADADGEATEYGLKSEDAPEVPLTIAAIEPLANTTTELSPEAPAPVPAEGQAENASAVPPVAAAAVADGMPVASDKPVAPVAEAAPTPVVPAPAVSEQAADDAPVVPAQSAPVRAAGHVSEQQQVQTATQQSAVPAAAANDEATASFQDAADQQLPQKQPDTQPVQAKPQEAKPSAQPEIAKPANPIADLASAKPQPDTLPEPVRALAASLNPASVNSMTMRAAALNERAPVPLTGTALAVEIVSRVRDGIRRFDIRLDPPELGRVDVRMEVDRAGNVKTHMTVDRPETLELVQREARGLERALQQAGLKTDGSGLEFSLRSQAEHPQADGQPGRGRERDLFADESGERIEAVIEGYKSAALARGGVDIRI